jgi:hypothetical protein
MSNNTAAPARREDGEALSYSLMYESLRRSLPAQDGTALLPDLGIDIASLPFHSEDVDDRPGGDEYRGMSSIFRALLRYFLKRNESSNAHLFRDLTMSDDKVVENNDFNYLTVLPHGVRKADKAVILLHGLNEKSWSKYLPWAASLSARNRCAVILFPLAFHMDRAPGAWADPRLMNAVARERAALFPGIRCSTFANAAISTRLQTEPGRFCLSGLRTMRDVAALVRYVRRGEHPCLEAGARVDLFGYSIGGLTGEMLLMSDAEGLFNDSRLVLFCAGAALDGMNPLSRAILDSEACAAVTGFLGPGLDRHVAADERLTRIFGAHEREARTFRLFTPVEGAARERRSVFMRLRERIRSISLTRDTVMPPSAVRAALNGATGATTSLDTELDFPYRYSHENPFPAGGRDGGLVDLAFGRTMALAAGFLG